MSDIGVAEIPVDEEERPLPPPEPLAKVSPLGSVSVTVIVPVAALGPPLFTVSVYCAPC